LLEQAQHLFPGIFGRRGMVAAALIAEKAVVGIGVAKDIVDNALGRQRRFDLVNLLG
jgi:hypothetical protein